MNEATTPIKKIMLKSSDGEVFEIDQKVADQSQVITYAIKTYEETIVPHAIQTGEVDTLPVPNVEGKILVKVIEYCKKHVVVSDSSSEQSKEDLKKWDAGFMNENESILYDVMLAANYLAIITLLDLTCQTVADNIQDKKTPKEIREYFKLDDGYETDDEKKIIEENKWAFE